MPVDLSSDNDNTSMPDAHGQAALLLTESLIHGLIARAIISVADAVEIIDTASEVKQEMAFDAGDASSTFKRAVGLLDAMSRSLHHDLPYEVAD